MSYIFYMECVTIINLGFHTWELFGTMRNDRHGIDAIRCTSFGNKKI